VKYRSRYEKEGPRIPPLLLWFIHSLLVQSFIDNKTRKRRKRLRKRRKRLRKRREEDYWFLWFWSHSFKGIPGTIFLSLFSFPWMVSWMTAFK